MQKILIFIDWYLPGYKAGGPVQSVANLVNFLKQYYIIDIITRNIDYTESVPYYNVKSNCWNKLEKNIRVFYFDEKDLSEKKIAYFIDPNIYQTVYINGVYSKFFSRLPLKIAKRKKITRIIVAPRGMFSIQALKVKPIRKQLFLYVSKFSKKYEKVIVHATNHFEKKILQKHFPTTNIISSPNFPRINKSKYKAIAKKKNELKLLFLGRIAAEKNLIFAIKILHKIKSGNIEFDLYGSVYDKTYWKKCKIEIDKLPDNIVVNYKGSIKSEAVFETINKYHVLFSPSLGENFGHTIYESLVSGRPVIISNNTPWRYLQEQKSGWDFDLNNKENFVQIIKDLLLIEQAKFDFLCNNSYLYACEYIEREQIKKWALKLFNYEQRS
ncbi:MAG: glycosyltransferase [Bacteroidales bacterium]|nr:glycosyltransferase [Bacteroidales bacterium]